MNRGVRERRCEWRCEWGCGNAGRARGLQLLALTSADPPVAAAIRASKPSLSVAERSAPRAMSSRTTSAWPMTEACMSAVTPSELRWFTLAPASRMMCSTVSEPLEDAAINAVIADLSWWRASTD